MRSLAEYAFDIGYYPISHQAVKTDFLKWYEEAAKSELVKEGLDLDNSQLAELAQEAQREAENFDQEHEIPQFVEAIEEYRAQLDIWIIYVAFAGLFIGGSSLALGILTTWNELVETLLHILGSLLLGGGVAVYLLYRVLIHQFKANSELIAKFNEQLVEKPGDVRNNDQRWYSLTAQFLWNKSLLSPATHISIIILTVVRKLSAKLYGKISRHLELELREAVGMSYRGFIKQEFKRIATGDFPAEPRNYHE